MKTEVGVRGFFNFFFFFPTEEAPKSMDVEDGENGASAGRVLRRPGEDAVLRRPGEDSASAGKLDVKANILMWWKLHAMRFPYLSRLARRYLTMPATSASVERLFSVAGQVVTVKRARLHPSTVTLLVFLHEAIPGGIEREAYKIIEAAM
jgi:hypothetical protein